MWCGIYDKLGGGRFAPKFEGAEHLSRGSQIAFNVLCGRVRAAEHAPRRRCQVLERRYALAEILERRAVVFAERQRVIPPYCEGELMILSENAPRNWYHFATQCLGFSVAF